MAALLQATFATTLEVFDHPVKGRCIRSLVQLQPGDVVLRESAVAIAPDMEFETDIAQVRHFSEGACFHCAASGGGSSWPCEEGCEFAFCSPVCAEHHTVVHRSECAYVEAFKSLGSKESVAASRLLLASRVAAACEVHPEQKRRVDLLEDFSDAMAAHAGDVTAAYSRIQAAASAPGFVQCDEGFELQPCSVPTTLLSKVYMSSLSLEGPADRSILALLPAVSLCAHSCRANCHVAHGGSGTVALRAVAAISPGEEVTISYGVDLGASGEARRTELERTRCFVCSCDRCTSTTEASSWDASTRERCKALTSLSHSVQVDRNMEDLSTLMSMMEGNSDAVSCQAGRVVWRTLRAQYHVEAETMAVLAALEPLVEAAWPAHHPLKAQLYLEYARHLANTGGDEAEFLRCCTAAQANAEICFGPDSPEAETMKQQMIDGQSDHELRTAPS